MTRRLFLHIGMMKSGTTYLQNMCNRNAEGLRRQGVRWLGGSAEEQTAAIAEFRGGGLAMPGDEGAWRRLRREIATNPHDALLSHELLAGLRVRRIRPFLDKLDADEIVVIVTARELSMVMPSRWQEDTQNRATTPWVEYLDAICGNEDNRLHRSFWRHADAGRALRDWSEAMPDAQACLVTVPQSGAEPHELWRRFASVVGVRPDLAEGTPEVGGNTSLGAVSAELMRRLNGEVQDVDWPTYRLGFKVGTAKRGLSQRASSEPTVQLPVERWAWVNERVDRMIGDIKAVGPTVIGDLDDLRPSQRRNQTPAAAWKPTEGELLDAALHGMAELGRQLARAELQLRESRMAQAVSDETSGSVTPESHAEPEPGPSWLSRLRALRKPGQ